MLKFDTELEEICFLRAFVKQEQRVKGELKSEIDELKYNTEALKKTIKEKNQELILERGLNLTPEMRKEFKKEQFFEDLKHQQKIHLAKIKALKRETENLTYTIIKLKNNIE